MSMAMKGGFFGFICLYYLATNNLMPAHSFPASAIVGHSWNPVGVITPDNYGSWVTGNETTAQILLSTATGCSKSGSNNFYSSPFGQSSSGNPPPFGLGFISNGHANYQQGGSILGIFMGADPSDSIGYEPVVVWSANGDHPVDKDASLHFTADGSLVLKDGRGLQVWSTNTSGRSVRSLNLTCSGNLVLVNNSGGIVWQSFDHPTDTWLLGQDWWSFPQTLFSRASRPNYSRGLFHVTGDGYEVHAFIDAASPVEYSFSFAPLMDMLHSNYDDIFTYVRLESDGHLRLLGYNVSEAPLMDMLQVEGGDCGYPLVCGRYGICSGDTSCGCPVNSDDNLNYFRQVDPSNSSLGCIPVNPLSCSDTNKSQTFLRLDNVTYFGFKSYFSFIGVDADECKRACLENCSCVAAIFHFEENLSSGRCSLPSELLTLRRLEGDSSGWDYNSTTYVKVQRSDKLTTNEEKGSSSVILKLVHAMSVSLLLMIVFSAGACYYTRRKTDVCLSDLAIDTVTRFSFDTLRAATLDFQSKLGRGGFGSVFEGTLGDGKKVAVKRLDSVGQGRKEFLAEVNTIGTLHHFNLVKLIGYCEEGAHRLLVYEYVVNGSLDKWIFNHDLAQILTWPLRKKIICEIAKGLEYLHENCSQNIIHFDIKPQNILLDGEFNAKISDFGLAKMVERDQAQVLTIIRGTPGYIAPELFAGRAISVKVDVYSFGVMALEIVCGRKNVGSPDEECLKNLVKAGADEDRLSDLVDVRTEDMQNHIEEAVKMMKVAIWCLQPHFIRPTMSMVVKVLQDLPNMETLADLSYLTITNEAIPTDWNPSYSTRPTESFLSGPR